MVYASSKKLHKSTIQYSIDLKEKVINCIKAINSPKKASIGFGIKKMLINRQYECKNNERHSLQKLPIGAKSLEPECYIQ
ncbi:hypothetical protein HCUR_01581 [Holospora curviuscula]|uniref:Transposase n=1 Tax=Holospora curviuscula TaxID=1082868 RepID=A0A2S5R6S3_9PROT|nr:hypothetical protein HCUR_01581 [Holospora curviuscula]